MLAMVIILAVPAQAADARSSSFFTRSSVYLYETSGTTFQAWFEVTAVRTMDKIGAKEIKIQRSSDNENWTTMKTYSMDDYSNMICENTVGHAACVTYTGTRGYYYRAYITLYAKDSTGTGTWTRYTSSIYID
jgi:hypothetical protein